MRLCPPLWPINLHFPASQGRGLWWFWDLRVWKILTFFFLLEFDCLWHWAFSSCHSHPPTPPRVYQQRFQTENFPENVLKWQLIVIDMYETNFTAIYLNIRIFPWKLSKKCILSGQVLNITETFQILLIFKGDCRAMLRMNNWRSHVRSKDRTANSSDLCKNSRGNIESFIDI